MLDFFTSGANAPFSIALLIVVILAVLEGVGALIGAGLSDLLDGLLPDVDADVDLDLDVDADAHLPDVAGAGAGFVTGVLAWLKIGRVPVIISLIVFLTAFGLGGLFLQQAWKGLAGFYIPGAIAWAPAVFVALPVMSGFSGLLAKVMPKDETTAVSQDSFIGRVAVVTLGTARKDAPAEAKLTDQHRLTHYVMVEPDSDGEEFAQGEEVVLVSRDDGKFHAIRNSSALLSSTNDDQ